MGFLRQEYWNGMTFPCPGDLPDPGNKPASVLAGRFFTTESPGKPIGLSHDATIPILVIYPKKMKTLIWKDKNSSIFTAALFTIAKIWKQPKCSLIWMDKEAVVHIHNEYYSVIKRMKSCHFVTTWMDLEGIILSETFGWRKTNITWFHSYIKKKKKKKPNEQNPTIKTPSNQRINKIKQKRIHRTG